MVSTEVTIGLTAILLTLAIGSMLYYYGNTSRTNYLVRGSEKLFKGEITQSIFWFWVVYVLILAVVGISDHLVLIKMIERSTGIQYEQVEVLVGDPGDAGVGISLAFIISVGTLAVCFGISFIISGLPRLFDIKLSFEKIYLVTLYAVGLLMLIVAVNWVVWVSLTGLLYVFISTFE